MINSDMKLTVALSMNSPVADVSPSLKNKVETTNEMRADTDTAKVSALSRQLSESAARAEKRDSSLTRSQLGELAQKLKNEFVGDSYQANKAKHNREIPKTSDPELLARARKATEFLGLMSVGDNSVKNPFTGLSREQLNVIAYDDGGPYTVNERQAAWTEVQQRESNWRMKVVTESAAESASNNGKTPKFYTELLTHYRSLPPIEQAQYPEGYEARLQTLIDEAENGQEPEEFEPLTLLQVIARLHQPQNETKKPDEPEAATESKTSSVSPEAYRSSPTTSLG